MKGFIGYVVVDREFGNAMVDMFSMCGCLDKAREVFESMRRGKNLLVTVGLMRVELFERCCSVDGYDEWVCSV